MSKFTDKLKIAGGMYIKDPNKVIATNPANSYDTRLTGLWSQIQDAAPSITSTSTLTGILGRLERLEIENKYLRLKIACMEGKFSEEEVINIRKMLMSQDESSVTLAETIINNA
jgi:hypothetical protein